MRNYSYENDFDLHENETACRTRFHMKGFALRLVLKQRHKRTRKWPIVKYALQSFPLPKRSVDETSFQPTSLSVVSIADYHYNFILTTTLFDQTFLTLRQNGIGLTGRE